MALQLVAANSGQQGWAVLAACSCVMTECSDQHVAVRICLFNRFTAVVLCTTNAPAAICQSGPQSFGYIIYIHTPNSVSSRMGLI